MQWFKKHLYFLKVWYKAVFLYPKSKIDTSIDYDAYWHARGRSEKASLNEWQIIRADKILATISKSDKTSVVDIGCGDGALLAYMLRKHTGIKALGVDGSDHALALAKKLGIEIRKIDYNTTSIKSLPDADYYLALELLEHVMRAEPLLAAMYEKAKRGVFISFPNTGYFTYRSRLLFGKFPLQWREHPSEHLRFWTLRDTRWWLSALGYGDYKIIPYKGVPILNSLSPSLFAAGLLIHIKKLTQ